MLVSSASEDLLVSLFWNKWKVFLNHFSFENYWDSTRSKTAVPSTPKMIMIVWRPHITGSRDHLNLSLQWLVSEGGVVSCTFWSRYVISLEKSTQNHFFLISLFLKNELDPQVSNEGFRGWPMLTRMPGRLEDKHREFERNTTSVSSSLFAFKFLLHPLFPL